MAVVETKFEVKVGDKLRHKTRNFTGVVVEVRLKETQMSVCRDTDGITDHAWVYPPSDKFWARVEVQPTPPPPPAPKLQVPELARALFNTDPKVQEDVGKYALEANGAATPNSFMLEAKATAWAGYGVRKAAAPYFQKAWDSNRNNWRTDAERRAAQVLEQLERGK